MRMLAGTEPLPPPTAKVFVAVDITPVVSSKSWVTDAYKVRIAITGLNDKNGALKAAWRTRMLDENGSGPTIPANLEDLLQRVLQYEAMERQFRAGETAGVKSTMFRGKPGRGVAKASGVPNKSGGKFRRPADKDTECFNSRRK